MIVQLHRLLSDVRHAAGADFAGVGIIVSASPNTLPVMPLCPGLGKSSFGSTLEMLTAMSRSADALHDGFHLLSPNFELVHASLYFSPPILPGMAANPDRRLGGRYWAALFGSALPEVMASGVASANYGVAVFEQGRELPIAA